MKLQNIVKKRTKQFSVKIFLSLKLNLQEEYSPGKNRLM